MSVKHILCVLCEVSMLSKRGKNRLRQAPLGLKFLSLFVVFYIYIYIYIHMFCETQVGFRNKARILYDSRNTFICFPSK